MCRAFYSCEGYTNYGILPTPIMADDADGANPNDEDIFIYTTGSIVPRDVVRARVHPSVTVIPVNAFICRKP